MRKRNNRVWLRLNDKELVQLDSNVRACGITREAYLRHLVNGFVPRAAPPKAFFDVVSELSRIGNNLNQIAAKAHRLNVIDVQQYDLNVRSLNDVIDKLMTAVVSPQPITEASSAPADQDTMSEKDTEDTEVTSVKSTTFDELFSRDEDDEFAADDSDEVF